MAPCMKKKEKGFSGTSCKLYPPLRSELHKRKPFAYFADWVCALRPAGELGIVLRLRKRGLWAGFAIRGFFIFVFVFVFVISKEGGCRGTTCLIVDLEFGGMLRNSHCTSVSLFSRSVRKGICKNLRCGLILVRFPDRTG